MNEARRTLLQEKRDIVRSPWGPIDAPTVKSLFLLLLSIYLLVSGVSGLACCWAVPCRKRAGGGARSSRRDKAPCSGDKKPKTDRGKKMMFGRFFAPWDSRVILRKKAGRQARKQTERLRAGLNREKAMKERHDMCTVGQVRSGIFPTTISSTGFSNASTSTERLKQWP
jgi:hypothetical protein